MFLRTDRCVSHQTLQQPMMRIVTFVYLPLSKWGQIVCAVYSALGITIGLLPDMYVLSGLISTLVCSLRPKGQKKYPKRHLSLKFSLLAQSGADVPAV